MLNLASSFLRCHCLAGMILLSLSLAGCGSGQQPSMTSTGSVNTSITDPPTCSSSFGDVWVTVAKVSAHTSSSAGPNDSGWVDLVDLTKTGSDPKQIDLLKLNSPTPACILTMLGSSSGLPAGTYQQIRLFLLDNNATGSTVTRLDGSQTNKCGPNATTGPFNCVVLSGGATQTLQLTSEAQTGLKISSGQIAGGSFMVKSGQATDLSIDFDACASIVRVGTAQFLLKPVLHAGEVSLQSNAISGKVVDSVNTSTPIPGAMVLLEQPDTNNVEQLVRQARTDAQGNFVFCPLPAGNYDVVVAAETACSTGMGNTTYNATVAFKVPPGTALNNLPLVAESTPPACSSPATLSGQVTTAKSGGGASTTQVALLAYQQAVSGGTTFQVLIPAFGVGTQPPTVTTTPTPTPSTPVCPSGTDCFNYSLLVPASPPEASTFTSGSLPAPSPQSSSNYILSGSVSACSPKTPTPLNVTSLAVTAGMTTNVSTLAFTGCP